MNSPHWTSHLSLLKYTNETIVSQCFIVLICILHHSNIVYALHSFMIYILLSSHNSSSQFPFLNCNNSKCVSDACSPLCSLLPHTAFHHCRIIIASDGKLFLGPCLLPSYTACKWQKARHVPGNKDTIFCSCSITAYFNIHAFWVLSHTKFRDDLKNWAGNSIH